MSASPYHHVKSEVVPMLASDELYAEFAKEPTRNAYAETVIELGEKNLKVVVLDADVSKSIGTNRFAEKFPCKKPLYP